MRPPKACLQCRLGKRRCDQRPGEGAACDQCVQRNLQCSSATPLADLARGSEQNQQNQRVAISPPRPLVKDADAQFDEEASYLVDLYVIYIHDKPHSLFHEPSLKQSVLDKTISKPLLLSIMGLSARYAEDEVVRSRGSLYAAEAREALKNNLENISVEAIQTCIIVGNHCMADCDPNAQSLYFVLANRMAQILRIWIPDAADDGITREVKTRVWWTCFILDAWASGGSGLSRQFQPAIQRVRVPMDEAIFFSMKPGDPDIPDAEWKPGLWGHTVDLVYIYSKIQDLHKDLAESVEWDEESIVDQVQRLDSEFAAFEQSLEPHVRYSRENLEMYIRRGLGRVFISFHLGFHHYATLLFYQYLDHRRPSTRKGGEYAERCKYHANMICEILRASREKEGAEAWYNIVGHVTVVSSSVLLHTYLFGQAHEQPEAKWRLGLNLETLKRLQSYYPSVERMASITTKYSPMKEAR